MSNTLLALDALNTVATHVQHVVALTVPDGDPQAPEGWTEKFGRIIGIAKWILLPLGVLGIIATAAMLFRNSRHEGGEIQERLLRIAFGLFLGLGAGGVVGFLVS